MPPNRFGVWPARVVIVLLLVWKCKGEGEEDVLLDFKRASDPHESLGNWIAGTSFCSWTGISCHSELQVPKVQRIELPYYGLAGIITPSIGKLTHLEILILGHNYFQGRIPPEILTDLDLGDNYLEGPIPDLFLTKLRTMDLSMNKLRGRIPLWVGNLSQLERMDISMNNLSGSIPAFSSNLVHFYFLDVSFNNLEGKIPENELFSRFSASAFLENPQLCGKVISRRCPIQTRLKLGMLLLFLLVTLSSGAGILLWAISKRANRVKQVPQIVRGEPKSYTQKEISSMTNNFSDRNKIGGGGFSTVFTGVLVHEDKVVAIKVLHRTNDSIKSFKREAYALATLKHRNIIKLFGYCWCKEVKALILEYMPNGSVGNAITHGRLDWKTKVNIIIQVAQAMNYLHHEFVVPVIHCDLNPNNILLDDEYCAHVCDFGISKLVGMVSTAHFNWTIGYVPPEYGISGSMTTEGDVYSYGMTILSLVTEKSPTNEMFENDFRTWIHSCLAKENLKDYLPQNLVGADIKEIKLILQVGLLCTRFRAAERPTMKEVNNMLLQITSTQQNTTPVSM